MDSHGIELVSTPVPPDEASDNNPSPQVEQEITSEVPNNMSRSSFLRTHLQIAATLLALFTALFLSALDFTIATTALPTITASISGAGAAYTWIGAAYLLASAISTPIWVSFADIFGRKPAFLAAVATFFAGSAVCAAAQNVEVLVAGRAVQGAAAGGVVVLVNVCISDIFSMRVRGFYLGLTGVVWAVASGVGPFLGGALTQYVSWRWNWWINLPCSGFAFGVLWFCLRVHNPQTSLWRGLQAIDWLGTVAVLGMSIMILLGLNIGGVFSPWNSSKVICLLVFGSIISFVFVVYESRIAKRPLIPLHVFRRRSNAASLLVCFCHSFVNMSSWYYLPLYFQSVLEATPLRSGILILPITIIQATVGVIAGVCIHHTGRYLELIWIGMSITTVGFGLFTRLGVASSLAEIVIFEIVAGIGVGLVFQAPLIALQTLVESEDVATATALFGFLRSLSTSISIVIGGAIFQNQMELQYNEFRFQLPADIAEMFDGSMATANVNTIRNLTLNQKQVIRAAFSDSLSSMWILYASVAGVGLIISLLISKQQLSAEHVAVKTGLKGDENRAPAVNEIDLAVAQPA